MRKLFFAVALSLAVVLTACGPRGDLGAASSVPDTPEVSSSDPPLAPSPNLTPGTVDSSRSEDTELAFSTQDSSSTKEEEPASNTQDSPGAEDASVEAPESVPDSAPEPVSSDRHNDAYFDNAVFVGDSIMEGIRQYVAKNRSKEQTLGSAEFLTSIAGVTVAGLAQDGTGYRYQGTEQPLQQILGQMGRSRVFLLLGLNDLELGDPQVSELIENYARMFDLLRETVPDVEIVVITNPPKVASSWLPDYTTNRNFGNPLISEFVESLIQLCSEQGVPCIDAHAALKNEKGVLPDSYCRDGFVHLNDIGSKVVVDLLYEFAAEKE